MGPAYPNTFTVEKNIQAANVITAKLTHSAFAWRWGFGATYSPSIYQPSLYTYEVQEEAQKK